MYRSKLSITNRPPCWSSFQAWTPQANGWVKVNFDAHMGQWDRGLGVVIRDASGALLAVCVRRSKSLWNMDIAEAYAAKLGVKLAVRLGYRHVHLEGDA